MVNDEARKNDEEQKLLLKMHLKPHTRVKRSIKQNKNKITNFNCYKI